MTEVPKFQSFFENDGRDMSEVEPSPIRNRDLLSSMILNLLSNKEKIQIIQQSLSYGFDEVSRKMIVTPYLDL